MRAVSDEPDGAPRLASLDILRGIAILGILFMNIPEMGGPFALLFGGDIRHFGWSATERALWFVREVIADGTARCLLELLFGAGMVILTERIAGDREPSTATWRYYRRSLILFGFGLTHVFVLLWPGDILHTYAIAAMIVFLLRRLDPPWLVAAGLLMAAQQLVTGGAGYVEVGRVRAERAEALARQAAGAALSPRDRTLIQKADEAAGRRKRDSALQAELAVEAQARGAATGDLASWSGSAWHTARRIVADGSELANIWEAGSTMLIGIALFRWGIVQGRRSRRFYAVMMAAGYLTGLPPRALGAWQVMRFDGAPDLSWFLYEPARLATTLGHVGAIHLLLGSALGTRLLAPFGAAGRAALSIYVLQTVACIWILYPPWGFGLYDRQGWTGMMVTALAVDTVLLAIAVAWMRRCRLAPVEWAWRSLAGGRLLAMRR